MILELVKLSEFEKEAAKEYNGDKLKSKIYREEALLTALKDRVVKKEKLLKEMYDELASYSI